MYPPPDLQDLTEEQALELDDTFLASDPFQYFSSRISSLLAWHESAPVSDAPLPGSGSGKGASDTGALSGHASSEEMRELKYWKGSEARNVSSSSRACSSVRSCKSGGGYMI